MLSAVEESLQNAVTAVRSVVVVALHVGAGVAVGAGDRVGTALGTHVMLMDPELHRNIQNVFVTWLMFQQRVWEKDEA